MENYHHLYLFHLIQMDELAGLKFEQNCRLILRKAEVLQMTQAFERKCYESGIARAEMTVARQSRRKKNTTITARMAPSTMAEIELSYWALV